jgi:streptogramin lyase
MRAAFALALGPLMLLTIGAMAVEEHDFSELNVEASYDVFSPYVGSVGDVVFVVHQERKVVMRFDAATGAASEAPIPDYVGFMDDFSVGDGAIWIPDKGTSAAFRIDVTSGAPVLMVAPGAVWSKGVAALNGSVFIGTYVRDTDQQQIVGYDAVTGAEQSRVVSPEPIFNLVAVGDRVWIDRLRHLMPFDPVTGSFGTAIPGDYDYTMKAAEGFLWAQNNNGTEVHKIDPETGAVLMKYSVDPYGMVNFAIGGGSLWFTGNGLALGQIDLATGEFLRRWVNGTGGNSVTYAGGSIWIIQEAGEKLLRLTPPQ